MRRTLVTMTVLGALVVAACQGSGDVGQVREDLDTQAEAQQALRERIRGIEGRLDELQAPDGTGDALAAVQERLDAVEQTAAGLAGRLDDERLAREDRDAGLSSALSDLQQTMLAVQGRLEELNVELQRLREEHELLLERFDRHAATHD